MVRKQKEIELFGEKLILAERTVADVRALEIFVSQQNGQMGDESVKMQSVITVILDGLKLNIKRLKWYEIFKRMKYKRMFKARYLIKNLTNNQLHELWKDVLTLEGQKIEENSKKKERPEPVSTKS